MQDESKWMIELVDAYKVEEYCFCIIRLWLNDAYYKLRFGVSENNYRRLRYILTFRPFENTDAGKYKYFTTGFPHGDKSGPEMLLSVRVEQLKQYKQFEFPIGKKCAANLLWFKAIKDEEKLEPFIIG